MKTFRFSRAPLLAFAALAICSNAFPQGARSPGPSFPVWEEQSQPSGRGRVQRINPRAESFGLQRMAGRPVRSRNGEQLSTVTDFLVDPQTGRVHFAILPSGAGPHGMTYRIVPISAFVGADEGALILGLDRAQWDRVGTIEEPLLKDRVTIDVDHQERLSRQLGLSRKEVYDGRGPAELVRATSLRGESIRWGNGQRNRVDDVVVDVTRHEFAIVLSMEGASAGAGRGDQRFVVGFQQLGKREGGGWVSKLTREDFQVPEPVVSAGEERGRRYESNDPRYRDQPADVSAEANAVKQAFDHSWARGRVEVIPERSRLVLRGMLDSEQERAEIEQLAMRAAPGIRIENQIALRRR